MRTRIVSIVIAMVILGGVYIIAQPMRIESFYWQDKLARPDETWEQGCINVDPNNVGISKLFKNDAQLAFNIRRLYALCQTYQNAMQQLDAELVKVKDRLNVIQNLPKENKDSNAAP